MRTPRAFTAAAVLLAAAPALATPDATPRPHPHADDEVQVVAGPGAGRLGARVVDMSAELRRYFGAPEEKGVLVSSVEPKSPAADAGLAAGDVIVSIDGEDVEDPGDLVGVLREKPSGATVKLGVIRAKRTLAVDARLREGRGRRVTITLPEMPELPDISALVGRHGGHRDDVRALRQRVDALEKRLAELEAKQAR